MRLTRRYILSDIKDIPLSSPIRYERYYIDDNIRIQRKNEIYEKEILENNVPISKYEITNNEFEKLKLNSKQAIIRDSYLYLNNSNISIKKYYEKYEGLYRIEVKFKTKEEMENFIPLEWFGNEITQTFLAFDNRLIKLTKSEFLTELKRYS